MKVAVFLPSLAGGGAERVTLALAAGLAERGCTVDVVVGTSDGPLRDAVPSTVTLHDLAAPRTLAAGPGLRRYLVGSRPDVIVSAISHANVVAAVTARSVRPRVPVVVVHHNTTSISTRNTVRRRDRLLPMLCALTYRLADRVVAVSRGVADDLVASSHFPAGRVQVIHNPIDYAGIRERSLRTVLPGTVPAGEAPLVIAAGRFERQKAFDVLLRAAAAADVPWRLAILGDGALRGELAALVDELGLGDRVLLPGFVDNPYPYFREAAVYALSSGWEGLPTVLVESLAFRLRIVSTDCPSGPREILTGVEGTELVPVGDPVALAAAIDRAVAAGPLTHDRDAWRRYDSDTVMTEIETLVRSVAA